MATRSRIGIMENDGTVKSVYCHWDGYPDNNGKILVENYNSEEKVRALLALGDISSLDAEVRPANGAKQDFEKPISGVTLCYADRGETDCEARVDADGDQFAQDCEEFGYLYDPRTNQWHCWDHYGKKFVDLYKLED